MNRRVTPLLHIRRHITARREIGRAYDVSQQLLKKRLTLRKSIPEPDIKRHSIPYLQTVHHGLANMSSDRQRDKVVHLDMNQRRGSIGLNDAFATGFAHSYIAVKDAAFPEVCAVSSFCHTPFSDFL